MVVLSTNPSTSSISVILDIVNSQQFRGFRIWEKNCLSMEGFYALSIVMNMAAGFSFESAKSSQRVSIKLGKAQKMDGIMLFVMNKFTHIQLDGCSSIIAVTVAIMRVLEVRTDGFTANHH